MVSKRFSLLLLQVGVVLFLPIIGITALLGVILRTIITTVAKIRKRGYCKLADPEDLMFISDTLTTKPHSAVIPTLVLDGLPNEQRIRQDFRALLSKRNKSTGERMYWKLTVVPEKFCGYWFWKSCPDFDVSNHLNFIGDWDLPVERLAEKVLRKPFPEGAPPWEVIIASPYMGSKKTLLLFRFGHCIMDGYSWIKLVMGLSGQAMSSGSLPVVRKEAPSLISLIPKLLTEGLSEHLKGWSKHSGKSVFRESSRVERMKRGRWMCAQTKRVSNEDIKHARKVFGATFSSIVLSAVSGGLQKYLTQQGLCELLPSKISSAFTLPKPNHPDGKLCNHWRPSILDLPFNRKNVESTIKEMEFVLTTARSSSAPELTIYVLKFLSFLPVGGYLDKLLLIENITLISSIAVSLDEFPNLFGMEVEDCFDFIPINRETVSNIAWACMSAKGHIRIGVTTENAYFPERKYVEQLTDCIYQEFGNIFKAALEVEKIKNE